MEESDEELCCDASAGNTNRTGQRKFAEGLCNWRHATAAHAERGWNRRHTAAAYAELRRPVSCGLRVQPGESGRVGRVNRVAHVAVR
jgi:hypothetical protein